MQTQPSTVMFLPFILFEDMRDTARHFNIFEISGQKSGSEKSTSIGCSAVSLNKTSFTRTLVLIIFSSIILSSLYARLLNSIRGEKNICKKSRPKSGFFLFKLKCACIKLIILAFFLNKLFVAAAFYNSAVVKHHNNVRVLNG